MKPRQPPLFATCQLCGHRDRLPSRVAAAIRAGTVALAGHLCSSCADTTAARAILAGWPQTETARRPIEQEESL